MKRQRRGQHQIRERGQGRIGRVAIQGDAKQNALDRTIHVGGVVAVAIIAEVGAPWAKWPRQFSRPCWHLATQFVAVSAVLDVIVAFLTGAPEDAWDGEVEDDSGLLPERIGASSEI